ncbi:MAG: TonB-dependent receptor, partial [Bacteroidetes bacterium]|nr:TonB-dependent receptor [Bacteroidota bacterium]
MIRQFVIFLIFLTFLEPGIGQTVLTGTVTDSETGQPLSGANISAGKRFGTVTGKDGIYSLTFSRGGIFRISVSYLGYETVTEEIEVTENSQIRKDFFLHPASILTQEVIIIGRNRELAEKLPARVEVLETERIESLPAQSADALLETVPGVNVNSTLGIFSSKTTVTLRGLSGNDQSRTLILIDGVPVNKADGGTVNWNMINKNNIERIVVVKGPASALYGSNAMGGAVNFITKRPETPFSGVIRAGYGTYNTLYSGMDIAGKYLKADTEKGFFWSLNSRYRKSDGYISELEEFITDEDSILTKTYFSEINVSAKAGYEFDRDNVIEVVASCFDDIRGSGIQVFEDMGANQEHDTWLFRGRYFGKKDKTNWQSNIYYTNENYRRMYEYYSEGE